MTPDGPAGPRRHVHQGLAYLSSRTGLPIVGAGMAFRDPWRAKSWDRFAVPRPYRAAACVVPEAVHVPPDADRETIEACRLEVERRMQEAHARRPRPGSSISDRREIGRSTDRRPGWACRVGGSSVRCRHMSSHAFDPAFAGRGDSSMASAP